MANDIKIVKLQVNAGNANPGTVGSILGQYGVDLRKFCSAFNELSLQKEEKGALLPVILKISKDRSFTMEIKAPPVAQMIIKAIGCKGSGEPNKKKVGKLTVEQLIQIVDKKRAELTGATDQALMNTVIGTAKSMGVEIEAEQK
jgi:large subunit ribosomal protein L11